MKITIPAPITLKVPRAEGEPLELEYSLADMVRHFVRSGREFSRTAEDARRGVRLLEAFDSAKPGAQVELGKEDGEALKAMAEKPSCGWASLRTSVQMQVPGGPGQQPTVRVVPQRVQIPTLEFLPLIDAIAAAT